MFTFFYLFIYFTQIIRFLSLPLINFEESSKDIQTMLLFSQVYFKIKDVLYLFRDGKERVEYLSAVGLRIKLSLLALIIYSYVDAHINDNHFYYEP